MGYNATVSFQNPAKTYEDLPDLINRLTPQDSQKWAGILARCMELNDAVAVSREQGHPDQWLRSHLFRLRKKYRQAETSDPTQILQKLGINERWSWQRVKALIDKEKSPTVKLRALESILKVLGQIQETQTAVQVNTGPRIQVNIVGNPEDNQSLLTGGRVHSETENETKAIETIEQQS